MKRIIPLIVLAYLMLMSCEKDSANPDREESEFVINLGPDFIFLGADNQPLIDADNPNTFPITFKDAYSSIDESDMTNYDNKCYYNGNKNVLTYNADTDKTIWTTIVYGFDNVKEYKTYVHFSNDDVDTILVKYNFTTECTGRNYCAGITEAYYNDQLIYSNKNKETKVVYVTKSGNETLVETE